MSYQYQDRDKERQNFENWQRYGKERGFFDRFTDTIRSWFGDEDAERRSYEDQQRSRGISGDYLQESERGQIPEWQRSDYSGPSPRGSRFEEVGRFDETEYPPTHGRYGRRYKRPESGRSWSSADRTWSSEQRYNNQPNLGREQQYPKRARFFDDNRDFESRMPLGADRWSEAQDERGYGIGQGYRGRGPRNYKRSDEQILDEIHRILTFHPEIDATDVDVTVETGVVILRGAVDSRGAKRLTEDIAEDVFGVREVHNELRVNRGDFQRPIGQTERDRSASL